MLNAGDMQLGRGETVEDTARVLSRMVDAVMIRANSHQDVLDFAAASDVPVINGLTDLSHPCQIIADLMTIEERRGDIAGKTIAWLGDGNNVCTSFVHAAEKLDFKLRIATPPNYAPRSQEIAAAKAAGADVEAGNDARKRRSLAPMWSSPTPGCRWAIPTRTRAWRRFRRSRWTKRLMQRAAQGAHVPALPAGASRRGSDRRGDGRPAIGGVGRSGKPHPRAEGGAAVVFGKSEAIGDRSIRTARLERQSSANAGIAT